MNRLENLLLYAAEKGVSDVHIKLGKPAVFRRHGALVVHPKAGETTQHELLNFMENLTTSEQRESLRKRGSVDVSYEVENGIRFRVHAFANRGELSLAVRVVNPAALNLELLNLPQAVAEMAEATRGLILVTGASGSGKSTTVASILQTINQKRSAHVVTIEDPIEYVFQDDRSIFSQREIGIDSVGFADALKASLRQDPDVILVGEIRDYETVKTALIAAETGHLVISTLHTIDAVETIQRITAMFPGDERETARHILSSVLHGVVSQRLVSKTDEKGRVPAVEILVANENVRELIRESERLEEIRDVIAKAGATYGMQTFDQSLMKHFEEGLVSYEEALRQSSNPADFKLLVSGISGTSAKNWGS